MKESYLSSFHFDSLKKTQGRGVQVAPKQKSLKKGKKKG